MPQVRAVLQADPVAACLVASRFEQVGMDPAQLGGSFWGVAGGRAGLCFVGSNVMPLSGDDRSMGLIARSLSKFPRRCASVVGAADLVRPLWDHLQNHWGPAREVRHEQPLLTCPDPPAVPADPQVARVGIERVEHYYPAAVAMFTEEVGVDPRAGDGGAGYRSRVASLLAAGRAFARFEGDQVVFKAEIGALSSRVALIQGVWVHPDWRGRGLAATGTAAVAAAAQRLGRLPSLYVNDHNASARAAYRRAGFVRAGTFASVLF